MKSIILTIAVAFIYVTMFAQNRISVCETKATHLVCPEKVTYVLAGDPSLIIAEIVPEHPDMVRVKALGPFQNETSLTLVSANRVYSLLVDYQNTSEIFYQMETFYAKKTGTTKGATTPEYMLKEMSWQVLSKTKKHIRNRDERKDGIQLRLSNIYLLQDVLFFELEITNTTLMDFDVEGFNWWIADKKQPKAVNVQEYQITPDYQHYNLMNIPAGSTLREVFVLPRLTIPDQRCLKMELLEKALGNTGRKLVLEIRNRDILRAREF